MANDLAILTVNTLVVVMVNFLTNDLFIVLKKQGRSSIGFNYCST